MYSLFNTCIFTIATFIHTWFYWLVAYCWEKVMDFVALVICTFAFVIGFVFLTNPGEKNK